MRVWVASAASALFSCCATRPEGRSPSAETRPAQTEVMVQGMNACPKEWRWVSSGRANLAPSDPAEAPLAASVGTGPYQVRRFGFDERCGEPVCVERVCTRGCSVGSGGSELSLTDGSGRVVWKRPLSRKAYEVAELVADEERVYVVSFVPAAPGAAVRAFDGRTGRTLYDRFVGGMACVYSMYSNRLRIELSEDRLLVWGWESAGRYVTAIEPSSGRVLCERLFDEVGCR